MKKNNLLYLFTLVAFGLFVSSCTRDDDDHKKDKENKITISIKEPTNGAKITNCKDVHVHVDIEATVENHEVEIVLHPEGDVNNKIIDFDKHEHDKVIKFEQEVDLCSFEAKTCFHLEVKACLDHDCKEKSTADAEFCLE